MSGKVKEAKPKRCEGYRRYGGVFTLGPVRWEQCKEQGTVMLAVEQDGEVQTMPACLKCWNEVIEKKIKVIEAKPI